MRKQTQECISTGFANAEVRLDALWSFQPHRWNNFIMKVFDFHSMDGHAARQAAGYTKAIRR